MLGLWPFDFVVKALQNAFQAYLQQMAAHEDEAEGRGQAPHWVNQVSTPNFY